MDRGVYRDFRGRLFAESVERWTGTNPEKKSRRTIPGARERDKVMKKLLHYCNENHWYIIAAVVIVGILVWLYGCQSQVKSIMHPDKLITRGELQLEADYLIGQTKVRLAELDKQDEIKRLVFEEAAIFGQTGTFNPTGLLNTLISVGAIAFGLDQRRKLAARTEV